MEIMSRDVPTTTENKVLWVTLYYWPDRKYYNVTVQPCRVDRSTPGMVSREFSLFGSGAVRRDVLTVTHRRSTRSDAEARAIVERMLPGILTEVCTQTGLLLDPYCQEARTMTAAARAAEQVPCAYCGTSSGNHSVGCSPRVRALSAEDAARRAQAPAPQVLRGPSAPGQLGE